MGLDDAIERVGDVVDVAGVAVIVLGVASAFGLFGWRMATRAPAAQAYRSVRRSTGQSLLLGLELLVAGDIIRSVATSPSFESVGVLAAIVLVRAFLSITLELEISGRWPWQRPDEQLEPS